MSNEFITTDHAYDTLDLLRRSVEDLITLRRVLRRAKREGKSVHSDYVSLNLAACIADIIESCAHLSQGDDADRIELSKELSARIIKEDLQ
jgi:hypothetical protein